MRVHRFVVGHKLESGQMTIRDPDTVHQIRSVLRLSIGSHIVVLDGCGHEADAIIQNVDRNSLLLHLGTVRSITAEPRRSVTLYCSILRRENFEWVVQKATEVGVARIVPLMSDRTVKTGLKKDRLLRIAREAVEQCGRGIVPIITDPVAFESAFLDAPLTNIFFDTGQENKEWPVTLQNEDEVGIWIGPEGGWSDAELELAKKNRCTFSSLGSLVLRAETAAVVAAYLAVHGGIDK